MKEILLCWAVGLFCLLLGRRWGDMSWHQKIRDIMETRRYEYDDSYAEAINDILHWE